MDGGLIFGKMRGFSAKMPRLTGTGGNPIYSRRLPIGHHASPEGLDRRAGAAQPAAGARRRHASWCYDVPKIGRKGAGEREKGRRREREVAKLITVFWGSGMFSSGPQREEAVAALWSGHEGASARRKMPRKR